MLIHMAASAATGGNELGWVAIVIIALQLAVGVLAVREALSRRRMAQHRAE